VGLNPDDFQWVSIESVTEPKGGMVEVLLNHWWLTNEAGDVCLYRGSAPQCNPNRQISEVLLPRTPGATDMVLIPVAFLRR
jgi:hypothetical protein